MENLGGVNRKLPHPFSAKNFFIRLADQVRQRKQGFSESFKDYMIDMQTMVRPLNYSAKETLRMIKENCTPSLRIFLEGVQSVGPGHADDISR